MKAILSSKGQLVIPKDIREKMGLHYGSELTLKLNNHCLEVSSKKYDISSFIGMGKKESQKKMSLNDIDLAIAEAVTTNDKY
jgi:AbrB family looped-hinge helix DNA binding protein